MAIFSLCLGGKPDGICVDCGAPATQKIQRCGWIDRNFDNQYIAEVCDSCFEINWKETPDLHEKRIEFARRCAKETPAGNRSTYDFLGPCGKQLVDNFANPDWPPNDAEFYHRLRDERRAAADAEASRFYAYKNMIDRNFVDEGLIAESFALAEAGAAYQAALMAICLWEIRTDGIHPLSYCISHYAVWVADRIAAGGYKYLGTGADLVAQDEARDAAMEKARKAQAVIAKEVGAADAALIRYQQA